MSELEPGFFQAAQWPDRPSRSILNQQEASAWQDAYKFRAEVEARLVEAQSEAQKTALQIHAQARAQGYADGKAAGELEATRLITETAAKVDRYLQSIERDVADLAIGIVRRVLGDFEGAHLVAAAAKEAVAELRQERMLKVTVHPEALERVRTTLARLGPAGPLVVEADARLKKTACIVATNSLVVDAGIEAQLAAISAALRDPAP